MPISAVFQTSTNWLTITFDQELIPKVLGGALGPWTVRISNLAKTFAAKTFTGFTAILTCNAGGVPDPGPDLVDYAPPPNNVESLATGLAAHAFNLTPSVIP